MNFPFTVIEQGLEFIFEKVACRTGYGWQSHCNELRFIGAGYSRYESQRVGACKHLAAVLTNQHVAHWREDFETKEHIQDLLESQRVQADAVRIDTELEIPHSRRIRDDAVFWNKFHKCYIVHVGGLTREDAINIYKMADSIRAEREA